jgi:hypothetical protein
MTRIALTGGAYTARSFAAAAQRQVNLYAEPMPEAQGEPARAALYPTPGLRTLVTLPTAPVRAIRQAATGDVFAVGGSTVYSLTGDWQATAIGTIGPNSTPVSMTDNGLDLLLVDGSAYGWHVTLETGAFAQVADTNFSGADRVDYLDTYLLSNVPGTPQFQSSDSLALTWDPLYFANKQAASDFLVAAVVAKREIWLVGERTTEVFYNSGAADFPFQSMPGVFIDHGACAKYSIAQIDNTVLFLSRDRTGTGIVVACSGYQANRISTFAIEAEFATYPTLTDAIGYCYTVQGHRFYVLTFPTADKTWAYDLSNPGWHELAWIDSNGREHRHRANCAALVHDTVVVGDWQTGQIYALDPAVFTDDGVPIKRYRSFPHMVADGKRVMFRQFLADMGPGLVASPTVQPLPTPVPTPAPTPAPTPPPTPTPVVMTIHAGSDARVNAYTSLVTVPVTLSAASTGTVSAHYQATDGYSGTGIITFTQSGDVVFAPGVTTINLIIGPVPMPPGRPTHSILTGLSAPVNATLAAPAYADTTLHA